MAMSAMEKMKKRFAGNMLTVGEMENVVGGAMTCTNQDAMFLKELGFDVKPTLGGEKAWEQAWETVGIKAVKSENGGSLYSFNGRSITQGEAWKMAREKAQGMKIPY